MTVVVTGADGYVGSNLVRALIAQGRSVRALVHDRPGRLDGLPCEVVPIDVREPDDLVYALDGAELVYHLAAVISITGSQGGRVEAVNIDGVGNVARAALQADVGRFVHFSSIHAFDLTDKSRPIDETSARPPVGHPAYDRSKAAGEARLREVIAEGLNAVVLNPTGIFGPIDPDPSRTGQFFRDLCRNRVPALPTGGFNWVDVRDLVQAALAAETRGEAGDNFIVNGRYASVAELAEITCRLAGTRRPRVTLPAAFLQAVVPLLEFLDRWTEGEPMFTAEAMHALRAHEEIDDQRARDVLGHAPRPLEESIADLVEVLQSRRSAPPSAEVGNAAAG